MRLRRRTLFGIVAVGLMIAIGLALDFALTKYLERRLMDGLGKRFESDVQVESLSVSLLPWPRISGRRLVLRHQHRTDVPPLITIASFSGRATFLGLLRSPIRVDRIMLDRLEINVPPGGVHLDDNDDDAQNDERDKDEVKESPLVIRSLQSERAVLRLLRRTPEKQPRVFEIHELTMTDVGATSPWPFQAELTNPKPPGRIKTAGAFGPWHAHDPARTPLNATYSFENADLGVFKGIQGILTSTGSFKGVLERIEVDGQTSVPAFALKDVGNPVPLETHFHAIVDGTNGDTLLQPVDAELLRTKIHTSGGVVEREGEEGRTVALDIVMTDAALEDVLRLAVKGDPPPMTGRLKLTASFVRPPGPGDGIKRMRLDGRFEVVAARFTKPRAQTKMDRFSANARAVNDEQADPVMSNFTGRFQARNGIIHFSNITFSMPGAHVSMAGRYVLDSNVVDFRGQVRLAAKLSQLTTGVKSFLLRIVDGLFRHDDITVVPITVRGPAKAPSVRLDYGKAVKGAQD